MDVVRTERRWMHRLKGLESIHLLPEDSTADTIEYIPFVYMETHIDFNDARTGYKTVENLAQALKIYSDHASLSWTEEMIMNVDINRINEGLPAGARLQPLPEFVDGNFIGGVETSYAEYLTRAWTAYLYRNVELNVYSGAGESRREFTLRCRELFQERMREELNQLDILFTRRREQLKEKYLGLAHKDNDDTSDLGIPLSRTSDRDIYAHYTERIAALFANEDHPSLRSTGLLAKNSELEERLILLETEVSETIEKLREEYEAKVSLMDEYTLHPNIKNIRCERSCIIWIPGKAK